ncbi:MAG: peptide chain release factor N(5)-glutamine methyltransferase [Firmicutes bacterium]|nr:peptide chain release factor N(5)-glutamine methyltransferase [Bacillota bacterium]
MRTIKRALADASALLKTANIPAPYREAQLILAHVLKTPVLKLMVDDQRILTDDEKARFKLAVFKRAAQMPLSYITGNREFMHWIFKVNRSVLIPRPESEILVELAHRELVQRFPGQKLLLADIGTGSGAIGLSLTAMLPGSNLHAVDISRDALQVAAENARNLEVAERVLFYRGNLSAPLKHLRGKLHCLVANLPYVSQRDYRRLPVGVRGFEPGSALAAGPDGLKFYRRLLAAVPELLRPRGIVLVEIGHNQARRVKRVFVQAGFACPRVVKDLAGHDRIVWAAKTNPSVF